MVTRYHAGVGVTQEGHDLEVYVGIKNKDFT
jgi:hypothetical protein